MNPAIRHILLPAALALALFAAAPWANAAGQPVALSGPEAAAALTGRSFKTKARTIWTFRTDGTQGSFKIQSAPKQWVAEGTWQVRGDLICWTSVVNYVRAQKRLDRPRDEICARVLRIGEVLDFTIGPQSMRRSKWDLREIRNPPPVPVLWIDR